MLSKSKFTGCAIGLGLFLILIPNDALAKKYEISTSSEEQINQFQKIEQPLGLKVAVALAGLSLISAELWWFMLRKTKQ